MPLRKRRQRSMFTLSTSKLNSRGHGKYQPSTQISSKFLQSLMQILQTLFWIRNHNTNTKGPSNTILTRFVWSWSWQMQLSQWKKPWTMFRAMFDVKVLVLVVNLKQNEVNKKQEQKVPSNKTPVHCAGTPIPFCRGWCWWHDKIMLPFFPLMVRLHVICIQPAESGVRVHSRISQDCKNQWRQTHHGHVCLEGGR